MSENIEELGAEVSEKLDPVVLKYLSQQCEALGLANKQSLIQKILESEFTFLPDNAYTIIDSVPCSPYRVIDNLLRTFQKPDALNLTPEAVFIHAINNNNPAIIQVFNHLQNHEPFGIRDDFVIAAFIGSIVGNHFSQIKNFYDLIAKFPNLKPIDSDIQKAYALGGQDESQQSKLNFLSNVHPQIRFILSTCFEDISLRKKLYFIDHLMSHYQFTFEEAYAWNQLPTNTRIAITYSIVFFKAALPMLESGNLPSDLFYLLWQKTLGTDTKTETMDMIKKINFTTLKDFILDGLDKRKHFYYQPESKILPKPVKNFFNKAVQTLFDKKFQYQENLMQLKEKCFESKSVNAIEQTFKLFTDPNAKIKLKQKDKELIEKQQNRFIR